MPTMLTDAYRWLDDITDDNWCYQWWPMFYQWWPMFTQMYQGIQNCQPLKSWNNGWKIRKMEQKLCGNTALDLKSKWIYPVPQLTWVKSASSGQIGYHRFYQLPLANHWLTIGKHWYCWHQWGPQYIFSNQW